MSFRKSVSRSDFVGLLALILLATASCDSEHPPLSLFEIVPGSVPNDHETDVLIRGSFYSPIRGDLRSGRQHIDEDFQVELDGRPLDGIVLMSENELAAIVPRHFGAGLFDLLVRDPLGREATLDEAMHILPRDDQRPVVEITSHRNGDRVLRGESISVSFTASDEPPGRIRAYQWTTSGAASVRGSRALARPVSEYFGIVPLTVPVEPVIRELVVVILAEDDAVETNYGTARVTLMVDICSHDRDCNDHIYCNGVERCVEGGCVAGEPINCDDGIRCTIDRCVESSRSCTHEADDSACDNGLFCDGVEVCDPYFGCLSGTPPCDDGVACTLDECIESELPGEPGECRFEPVDELCDDGVFCNGVERCLPGRGCVDGPDPCTDAQECTVNICQEHERLCDIRLNHEICDDGLDCTIDLCDKDMGCVNVPGTEGPPGHESCADGIDNDCDGLIDLEDPDCR